MQPKLGTGMAEWMKFPFERKANVFSICKQRGSFSVLYGGSEQRFAYIGESCSVFEV